ncbi:hypothetical protein [Tenacibaculum sp. IB213877]|uniref:hypothetical protein n=1 Tax=Tenacibaculum sp. IB213877 TaxID=3097351 RepID=UPI002A5A3F34|nr:hypothetical protein [Tenacibaculum sp. IB213877]MDY0779838.1 hypothetical protein [Tenacibaculum sp. IB213877]
MIVIHDSDHIRQAICWNYKIPLSVWLVNISVYTPSIIGLYFVYKKYNLATTTTIINGLLVAVAFAKVHLWKPTIPVWGIWNKNFFLLGVDAISWTVLVVTILVGIGVSMSGVYVKGRQSIIHE